MRVSEISRPESGDGSSSQGINPQGITFSRSQVPQLVGTEQAEDIAAEAVLEGLINQAVRLLHSWQRILVTSHRDPDGDALGATLGLTLALKSRGYDVTVVNADPLIRAGSGRTAQIQRVGLAAIPGADLLISWEQIGDHPFDGFVLIDCGAIDRLHRDSTIPGAVVARSRDLLVIDHHLAPAQRSDGGVQGSHTGETVRIVDPTRASSAELVTMVIQAAGLPLDPDIATALLTGVATDTKGFLRESTDARALACASLLRALNGKISVAEDILERHSVGFLILAKDVLSRALFIEDGAGIVASIPRSLLASCRVGDGEVERLTTILSGTREAQAIVLLQEQASEIRGSVRTREPVDALTVAGQFGGGGHSRRAGFRVPGAQLDQIIDEVSVVVRSAVSGDTEVPR